MDALTELVTLIILGLVCWRISSLLTREYGPAHVFARLRDIVGVHYDEYSHCVGSNVFAEALCCFKCTSVWIAWLVAAIFAYDPDPRRYVVRVLAISAIAIVINGRSNGA